MKTTILLVVLILMAAPVVIMAPNAAATTTHAWLLPNGVLSSSVETDSLTDSTIDSLIPRCMDYHIAAVAASTANWWGPQENLWDSNYYDAAPGSVWFGEVTSETDPDGIYGMGNLRVTLDDLTESEMAASDYWTVSVQIFGMMTGGPLDVNASSPGDPWGPQTLAVHTPAASIRMGLGYTDAATGSSEVLDDTYHYLETWGEIGGSTLYINYLISEDYPYVGGQMLNQENLALDRPFTTDEINHMHLWLQWRLDQVTYDGWYSADPGDIPPYRFKVAWVLIYLTSSTYTPPDDPGTFILRPNDDIANNGWTNYSVDDYQGLYGATNESGWMGDGTESYINSTWAISRGFRLGFTDVPDGVPDSARFTITLCMVARETVEYNSNMIVTSIFAAEGFLYNQSATTPAAYWMNLTHECDLSPDTEETWTVEELNLMQVVFNLWANPFLDPDGECQITQIQVICYPVEGYDSTLPPDFEPIDFDDVAVWLSEGHGFSTIFAIMGAFGMFLVAPFIAISVREDKKKAFEAIVLGLVIFACSFAMFIAGTSPWS